ncbi:hypothetical protein PYW07_014841 [Mythimna separata]|uniref:Uncharacterized protein n=1 Tax=Mythimna separata TaxID=271217 RepID=A0AAD8DZC6_MYTSE|nr:hypothetical protein PYW07_014841 [Mythimna separata]
MLVQLLLFGCACALGTADEVPPYVDMLDTLSDAAKLLVENVLSMNEDVPLLDDSRRHYAEIVYVVHDEATTQMGCAIIHDYFKDYQKNIEKSSVFALSNPKKVVKGTEQRLEDVFKAVSQLVKLVDDSVKTKAPDASNADVDKVIDDKVNKDLEKYKFSKDVYLAAAKAATEFKKNHDLYYGPESYKYAMNSGSYADWDEMRHFFASYPWQQVCFSSENPSSCAEAMSDVVRQAMEYYIPHSDVPVGSSARPWFNADCAEAEKRKHSPFLSWEDARDRKAPDLSSKKRAFNHAAKSYKKALRKARFDRISHIGQKLSAQPSGSRAFWSLAKSVEANFCRPTLPPLVRPDGTLAHTAREKAGLFASLFAHNSRLDTGSATPPTLPHCGTSIPEITMFVQLLLFACACALGTADEVPPYVDMLASLKDATKLLKDNVLSIKEDVPFLNDSRRHYAEIVYVVHDEATSEMSCIGHDYFKDYQKNIEKSSIVALHKPKKVVKGTKNMLEDVVKAVKPFLQLVKDSVKTKAPDASNADVDKVIDDKVNKDLEKYKFSKKVYLAAAKAATEFKKNHDLYYGPESDKLNAHNFVITGAEKLEKPVKALKDLYEALYSFHNNKGLSSVKTTKAHKH